MIKVFSYFFAPRWRVWTWTCGWCGIGHSSPQMGIYDTQPVALSAALRHCREARLS